jgi:hypothetical protein
MITGYYNADNLVMPKYRGYSILGQCDLLNFSILLYTEKPC